MKKKIISMLVIILAIVFMGGCGEKKTDSVKDQKMQIGEVKFQDLIFSVTSPFESVKEKLGEPLNFCFLDSSVVRLVFQLLHHLSQSKKN